MKYLKKYESLIRPIPSESIIITVMNLFSVDNIIEVNQECNIIERFSGGQSDVMVELLYIYLPKEESDYSEYYNVRVVFLDNKGYEVNKLYSNLTISSRNHIRKILDKKFHNYDIQKKVLDEQPEKYEKMKEFGFAPGIEEEFNFLETGKDMGLL